MGFLRKLLGGQRPIEVMRADIYMQYDPIAATGEAAVEWVPLESNDSNLRPFLVALLYARSLVIQAETRVKLFELVGDISKKNVRDEGRSGFSFPGWVLPIGFGAPEQKIWPWELVGGPGELNECKVYRATLLAFPQIRKWAINLSMARGHERILIPASSLILISSYAQSTDQEGRYELAILLWQINCFYGFPEELRIGSETDALAAATAAIRSGGLMAP